MIIIIEPVELFNGSSLIITKRTRPELLRLVAELTNTT
jgi:hypothetical protein